MMTSIADLEEAVVSAICDLDATSWHQDDFRPNWHESETPLDPSSESSGRAHLAFAVWADGAPVEPARGCMKARPNIRVRFYYRLRAGQKPADMRCATRAAEQIAHALDGSHANGARLVVTNAGAKTVATGGWADVTLAVRGLIELKAAA